MRTYTCVSGVYGSVVERSPGPVGPGIEPPPGHRSCGRQASLTLAVYSVHSFKVFLILKVGQKLYRAYVHC